MVIRSSYKENLLKEVWGSITENIDTFIQSGSHLSLGLFICHILMGPFRTASSQN